MEISLAIFSLVTTTKSSPAFGGESRPLINTGTEGPADFNASEFSSTKLLIFLVCSPTKIMSPAFKVPSCTRTVATAPFPFSVLESRTTPWAGPL